MAAERVEPIVAYEPFAPQSAEACLELFDRNCPDFFAPSERSDYEAFLATQGEGYVVCRAAGQVVGAFGLMSDPSAGRGRLVWIMLHPNSQGLGIGRTIMHEAGRLSRERGLAVVDIAASHLSAPFFARFGARAGTVTDDGWGPGMHRVDMEWPIANSD